MKRSGTQAEIYLAARASAAIAAGVQFLEGRQLSNGELVVNIWRPVVPEWKHDPSIFGTALITWSLDSLPEAKRVRERACDFIYSQRELHGVWRHWTRGHEQFHYVAPDLDNSSVACLALRANGRRAPDNRRLMVANRAANGLFYTWITLRRRWVGNLAYWWVSLLHLVTHPVKSIGFYRLTPSERHDIDAVVNANVLFNLGRDRDTEAVVPFLLRVIEERRETDCDKWYDSPFVVWYFFSRALRRAGADAEDLLLGRLRDVQAESALDHALAASVQMDWNARVSDEAINAIIGAQLRSGGWPLAPFYKGARVRWGSEEMSTGFCIEALSRWLGKPDG